MPGEARVGMRIKSQDFATGLLFIAVGAAALWIGADYPMGTPQRPGTGVLPRILAWCLIGTGALLWLKAVVTDGPRLTAWAWRPAIMITLATVAFALLVDRAGLVVTMLVSMTLAALGTPETRWREYALFAAHHAGHRRRRVHLRPRHADPDPAEGASHGSRRPSSTISRSGFSVAVTLQNLFWCLMGAVIGTAIGVLPGVGPVATMALLLPVTYLLPAEGALIMLAGIYYGAQYGGSTTAILVNLPGESSSVVTTLDGYQMARQGRAGPALAIAAIGSFFAGCVATIVIAVAAPPLTRLAQQFTPPDYFSLMVLGLVFAIVLARGSVLKAFGMVFLGMLLGLVGTDVNTGNTRFTFDISDLFDGIGFVPLAMGVFGIAEIIANLTNPERRDLVSSKVSGLMPTREDLKRSHRARSCAARSWAACSASCPAAARSWPRSRPTRWRRSSRGRRRSSAPA